MIDYSYSNSNDTVYDEFFHGIEMKNRKVSPDNDDSDEEELPVIPSLEDDGKSVAKTASSTAQTSTNESKIQNNTRAKPSSDNKNSVIDDKLSIDTSNATSFSWYWLFHEICLSGDMSTTQQYFYTRSSSSIVFALLLCIDVVLRGIAQVFLCNHPISGIFICI